MKEQKILPCKCGASARIRHRYPYTWVECKRKCGMSSGFVSDIADNNREDCETFAVELWNKKISKKDR